MTVTVTDQRIILDEADVANWVGASETVYTSAPSPVELTGCLGFTIDNEEAHAYAPITSDNWSAGGTFSMWVRAFGTMNTFALGGIQMVMGDNSNRVGYYIAGSDKSGFKHSLGPAEWQNVVMDPANKPTGQTEYLGTDAALNEAAITQAGVAFYTLEKALGGVENCFVDILRWADIGVGVTFVGGTTSGAAGNMADASTADLDDVDDLGGLGAVHEVATGVYGIQANIIIGASASSSDQYWTENNVTYAWESRNLSSANYYRFQLIGSSTATNCEVDFTSTTFNVPVAASASFDGDGADLTVCNLLNCALIGFDQGVETSSLSGSDWSGSSYIGCGQVVYNGVDVTGGTVSGSVVAADIGSLLYDIAADPDGDLDDMTFEMGAANHHAIDFGTNVDSSLTAITLRDIAFNGFGSVADSDNSTVRFLATTGALQLSLVGCTVDGAGASSSNFSIDDAAGITVTPVFDTIPLKVTVLDASTGLPITDARVYLHKDGDTGTVYFETETDVNGEVNDSIAYPGDTDVVGWVRQMDVSGTDYTPKNIAGQITSTGFGVIVQLEPIT